MTRAPSSTASTAELFEHYDWVLGLARGLVGDGAADDVAQQTMLAALRKPPEARDSVRPWLSRVAANFGAKWRRSEQRRHRHETAAAPVERPVPSPAEIVESSETLQTLMAELAQLDQPLRDVVTLRYIQGLDSSAIAKRLEIPAGTARWRLARGLEVLRARLDARHDGDRQQWRGALTAVLGFGAQAAAPATAAQSGLLVAAAALLLTGVWAVAHALGWLGAEDTTGVPVTSAGAVDTHDADATGAGTAADADSLAAGSDAGASDRTPVTGQSPPPAPTYSLSAHDAGVMVHITDVDGAPLRGNIEWTGGPNAFGIANGDGVAWFAFDPPAHGARTRFRIEARGYATRLVDGFVRNGAWLDLGTVQLPRSRRIQGRVVDAHGAPSAAVTVFVAPAGAAEPSAAERQHGPPLWRDYELRTARTASDGTFFIEGVPAVPVRAWCFDAQSEFGFSEVLGPDSDREPVALRKAPLALANRILGEVVDAQGRPVTDALVRCVAVAGSERVRAQRPVRIGVDGEGRFELPARVGVTYELLVIDDSGHWQDVTVTPVRCGAKIVAQFVQPR